MIRMYGWTAQTEGRENKAGSHLILSYPVHPVQPRARRREGQPPPGAKLATRAAAERPARTPLPCTSQEGLSPSGACLRVPSVERVSGKKMSSGPLPGWAAWHVSCAAHPRWGSRSGRRHPTGENRSGPHSPPCLQQDHHSPKANGLSAQAHIRCHAECRSRRR